MSAPRRPREVLDALLEAERASADTYQLLLKSFGSPQEEAAARSAYDEARAAFVVRYGEALDALEARAER